MFSSVDSRRRSLNGKLPRLAAAAALLIVAVVILLNANTRVEPVLKIGLVAPFEGRQRQLGYDVIYSARMAVREINGRGGIGGYRIALVALDDSGDAQLATAAAASLAADPAIVAVVGHWLPETTAAALPVYAAAGVATIDSSGDTFGHFEPSHLPASFRTSYEAVTPFDETAGPYAGPAYDAFQLLWQALEATSEKSGRIDRSGVFASIGSQRYAGLTGEVAPR